MKQIFDPLNFKVNWEYRTILIVEDVESNFRYLKQALDKTGAKILHAQTGGEAVDICANNIDIDLVLMDLHLPGISGYDATREIKKIRKDITVIAQTAFVFSGEKQKCIDVGCDDYIAKPIRSDELIFKIRSCLINSGKEA
ncbi:MAG: response regulator [Bacteroidales bacterium]|nr:response regulator [Bacteroidales bacterium]